MALELELIDPRFTGNKYILEFGTDQMRRLVKFLTKPIQFKEGDLHSGLFLLLTLGTLVESDEPLDAEIPWLTETELYVLINRYRAVTAIAIVDLNTEHVSIPVPLERIRQLIDDWLAAGLEE